MVTKKKVSKPKSKRVSLKKENITMTVTPKMMQNEMNMDTDMMIDEMIEKTQSGKIDFDHILSECLKKQDLFTSGMTKNEKNKMNKNYENSFDEIAKFRESITSNDVRQIDTIIYHDENNDGVFSAVIAYHYLMTELFKNNANKREKLQLIPDKPRGGVRFLNPRNIEKLKGRNVLIVDLDYHPDYLKQLQQQCASVMIIDDHQAKNTVNQSKIFVGTNHAACANVWKFFYPSKPIPEVIKMIDISDSKKQLGAYSNYMNLFTLFIGHRYTHNKRMKKDLKQLMNELWDKVIEANSVNAFIVGGHYMDEVQESLKEQIAINAKPAKFQGYNVGVLNFNAPALKKMVGRQINTNFERMGQPIDFAVVWGYEYTSGSYDITLIDNHRPESTINLADIAIKLGKICGDKRGGGGHPHQSHFYLKRSQKMDIWDLFEKQLI